MYPTASPIMTVQTDLNALRLDADPSGLSVSDLTSYDLVTETDMQQLSLEIEKERYFTRIIGLFLVIYKITQKKKISVLFTQKWFI